MLLYHDQTSHLEIVIPLKPVGLAHEAAEELASGVKHLTCDVILLFKEVSARGCVETNLFHLLLRQRVEVLLKSGEILLCWSRGGT